MDDSQNPGLRCSKCGSLNALGAKYCNACGSKFVAIPPARAAGEDGAYFCYRHPKEVTRVTCGRCERPICTKCIVMSPAGVRCRDCAKNRVPISVRGLAHDAASGISGIDGRKIWYLYIWSAVIRFIAGFFGRW